MARWALYNQATGAVVGMYVAINQKREPTPPPGFSVLKLKTADPNPINVFPWTVQAGSLVQGKAAASSVAATAQAVASPWSSPSPAASAHSTSGSQTP